MHRLARLDHLHVWHPFTQMRDWLKREPVVIVSGNGAVLRDIHGKEYLDANSSIWTNLHGHRNPAIDAAIQKQLRKIAHSSALGLANEPASLLAAELIRSAECGVRSAELRRAGQPGVIPQSAIRNPHLTRVFFSDDGATAMEVALKLAYEFARRTRGNQRPKFLSLQGAYHGDTVGAVSLGHIDLFHKAYSGLTFKTDAVMSPFCYRCPYNRAKPERGDAREYRKCRWECVDRVGQRLERQRKLGAPYAGMVVEPLIQGAAGMMPQPDGWMRRVADLVREHGSLLIADEVMTGFGRTGFIEAEAAPVSEKVSERVSGKRFSVHSPTHPSTHSLRQSVCLFACQRARIQPDLLALAKGLTGGYLPMAATLTTQAVFDAFLGEYSDFKTFFHGHSYTGNQLGAAAALASLKLLQTRTSIQSRTGLQQTLSGLLPSLWSSSNVGDIRQVGLIVGVELVEDWRSRKPFDFRRRIGFQVCEAMARRGVLTRPIGDVIVLMPPFCTSAAQAERMVSALRQSIGEVLTS